MSYLEFYKLSKEPFHITPDPEFLYLSPSHKEALGVFLYGVRQRKGIISVTGEVGVGKTTVLRRYLEKIDPENLKPIYLFNSNITFQELVKMLHEELGVETSGSSVAEMVNGLHHALIQQYKDGKNVVLIVDEAQNMPNETLEHLRMLSNLETAKDKLLQIVLIGQPELDEKLALHQLRQLKQRIAVRATIRPLEQKESLEYIQSRLEKCADEPNEPVFSKDAIHAIVQEAQGIPRTINILCDNALITGYGYEQKPISRKIAKEVISDFRGDLHPQKRYSLGWIMGIFLFLLALSGIAWMLELTPSHHSGGGSTSRVTTAPAGTNSKPVQQPKKSAMAEEGASLHIKRQPTKIQSEPALSATNKVEVKTPQASPAEQKNVSPASSRGATNGSQNQARRNLLPPQNAKHQAVAAVKSRRGQPPEKAPASVAEQQPPPSPPVQLEAAKVEDPPEPAASDASDVSAKSEAEKKMAIEKELEVERGRKIQLLLQAQQRSAAAGLQSAQASDSTENRVDSNPSPPSQAIEKSDDATRERSTIPVAPLNKSATPPPQKHDGKPAAPETTAQPEIRPLLTQIVRPTYPRSFRGRNVDGTVLLSVLVSQRGDVEAIRVVHGINGNPDFTTQAINAVRQWKFRPAIDHGVRVKAWVSCPIVFRKQ